MSIAVTVKVHDGIVLASDSASTVIGSSPQGAEGVMNVYNHADKIFNLCKGLPVGMSTFGIGAIGEQSMAALAKDLRVRFSSEGEWGLDSKSYTMEDIANRVYEFFYKENYMEIYADAEKQQTLVFYVCGYSGKGSGSEVWEIRIHKGECDGPQILRSTSETGANWGGEGEAVSRLIKGVPPSFRQALNSLGVPKEQIDPAMSKIGSMLEAPLVIPAMPIQDAIDLAYFLVDTTIKFVRFLPGAPTVGGEIDLAVITKHEGFKWVRRKHYYDLSVNPDLLLRTKNHG